MMRTATTACGGRGVTREKADSRIENSTRSRSRSAKRLGANSAIATATADAVHASFSSEF